MLGSRWSAPNGGKVPETHILVTHYHWDHIQGIPFFSPLYTENNEFQFYSFRSKFLGRDSLKQVFEAQMALPYFPVDMSAMSAKRKFKEVEGGDSFEVGENKITARWLNHPQGCLGFRIETPAGTVAYATDNEPGDAKLDESLLELAAGADILINDAQFTPEQLETTRKGWGHSSWLEGVKVARKTGAKTLVLFHHDPDSTDRMVDTILRQAREEFDSVFAASEGMVIHARRAGRHRSGAHAGNKNGAAPRSEIPRESLRRDRRREKLRGRDHRPGYILARSADFAEPPAAAAIGAASDHGSAGHEWHAIDEAAGIRGADRCGARKGTQRRGSGVSRIKGKSSNH